jgi:hypothetical protein
MNQSYQKLIDRLKSISIKSTNDGMFIADAFKIIISDFVENKTYRNQILEVYYRYLKEYEQTFYKDIRIEIDNTKDKPHLVMKINDFIENIQMKGLETGLFDTITVLRNDTNVLLEDLSDNEQVSIEKLKEVHREFISEVLKELRFYKVWLTNFVHSDIIVEAEKLSQNKKKKNKLPERLSSFTWTGDPSEFKILFDICYRENLFETDLETFKKAFTAKDISEPLAIKWTLKQKRNKNTVNKKAIFAFLDRLHDEGKLEEKFSTDDGHKQGVHNKVLFKKLCSIFSIEQKLKLDANNIRQNFNNFKNNKRCDEINSIINEFINHLSTH